MFVLDYLWGVENYKAKKIFNLEGWPPGAILWLDFSAFDEFGPFFVVLIAFPKISGSKFFYHNNHNALH